MEEHRIIRQANLSSYNSDDHTEIVCLEESVPSAWNMHTIYVWFDNDGSVTINQTIADSARTITLEREHMASFLTAYHDYMVRVRNSKNPLDLSFLEPHDPSDEALDDHPF